MGGVFRALRCDRKRAVRLPLRLEVLEDRTLLSGIATPDYVIFHGSSGGGGVATPYGSRGPTASSMVRPGSGCKPAARQNASIPHKFANACLR